MRVQGIGYGGTEYGGTVSMCECACAPTSPNLSPQGAPRCEGADTSFNCGAPIATMAGGRGGCGGGVRASDGELIVITFTSLEFRMKG